MYVCALIPCLLACSLRSARSLSPFDLTPLSCLQNKLFGNLGLGSPCAVQLDFSSPNGGSLTTIKIKNKPGEPDTVPVFTNKDTLSGSVKVSPVPGKRVEHQGIRVQLVGEIETVSERGHPHEFLSLGKNLEILLPCGDRNLAVSNPSAIQKFVCLLFISSQTFPLLQCAILHPQENSILSRSSPLNSARWKCSTSRTKECKYDCSTPSESPLFVVWVKAL